MTDKEAPRLTLVPEEKIGSKEKAAKIFKSYCDRHYGPSNPPPLDEALMREVSTGFSTTVAKFFNNKIPGGLHITSFGTGGMRDEFAPVEGYSIFTTQRGTPVAGGAITISVAWKRNRHEMHRVIVLSRYIDDPKLYAHVLDAKDRTKLASYEIDRE